MKESVIENIGEVAKDKENIKKLTVQEIIFMIFKLQSGENREELKEDIKIYIDGLSEKLIESEKLYIAYNKITNYMHTDYERRAWIFSEEEFGELAREHFEKTGLNLYIKGLNNDEIIKSFSEFYRLGIEGIVIDNGQYTLNLEREKLIPAMDYSGFDEKDIPVTNPELCYSMMKFRQELDNKKNNYEGKEKVLSYLELEMMKEIVQGKYLVPIMELKDLKKEGGVFLKKKDEVHYGTLKDEKGKEYCPIFTDWIEFKKNYDTEVWIGKKCSYNEIVELVKGKKDIVINPSGFKIQINEKNKEKIEIFEEGLGKEKEQKEIELKILEAKNLPVEMLEELRVYMKKIKEIKRAYFRGIKMGNEEKNLLILDTEEVKEEVLEELRKIYKNYIKDKEIEITEKISFRESLDKIEPFYKKKKFIIF
ncbi:MAG: enhanced serine sensitivity protein SseB C-terminal domain-containing protein [Clostridium sp.]|uniref:enhanced serine sensitivity protein SseB C-terminal domain-containing protein n=1 Tax=Clostridium sp. TaxID=1506 RepID=UPI003F311A9F